MFETIFRKRLSIFYRGRGQIGLSLNPMGICTPHPCPAAFFMGAASSIFNALMPIKNPKTS